MLLHRAEATILGIIAAMEWQDGNRERALEYLRRSWRRVSQAHDLAGIAEARGELARAATWRVAHRPVSAELLDELAHNAEAKTRT